jgi:hypothetical protein
MSPADSRPRSACHRGERRGTIQEVVRGVAVEQSCGPWTPPVPLRDRRCRCRHTRDGSAAPGFQDAAASRDPAPASRVPRLPTLTSSSRWSIVSAALS